MHKVNAVVLDKTGTITTGKMNVVDVIASKSAIRNPQSAIVQYAASAEQGSEHLMASAIVRYAKDHQIELYPFDSFRAVPGQGAEATVEGSRVLIGKREFLESNGVAIDPATAHEAYQIEQTGKTVVWVSRDNTFLGLLVLMDVPKEDSQEAISQLKRMNIDVTMVTGDNGGTAQAIADQTGIASVIAGVLPQGKIEEIFRLKAQGRVVAMVGDGINDAPALAAADIGIAMASGSDIAMESADVVLMRSDLKSVVQAIELSRKTFRIIKQNLFWAFFLQCCGDTACHGRYPESDRCRGSNGDKFRDRGDELIEVEINTMLWTIIALIILMFFVGLAGWFIFLWAVKSGQFDDIERPKHRMMDDDS